MIYPPVSSDRDFRGYYGNEPAIRWPNGARLAVSIVVNIEEGAELSSPLAMRAMNSSMKRLNVLKGRAICVWRAITPMARAVAGAAFAKHLAVMA